MAQTLKPFRATVYSSKKVKDFSTVTCPPYDVISDGYLKLLKKKSLFNFSRILLADKNNYASKRKTLDSWLEQDVLVEDDKESLYLYEQKYKVNGKRIIRFGIITLLQMDKQGIFPHEHTHQAPKEDRKKIIRAVEANLSPIFVIAAAKIKYLDKIYKKYKNKRPFISCKDRDKNPNRIWRIHDKDDISRLCKDFSKPKLIIADGHHRFEISYDYFKKFKNKFKDLNYLMAYLTDCQKGLLILPTHRIAEISESDRDFFTKLKKYFNFETVSKQGLKSKLDSSKGFSFGICRKRKIYFARLKSKKSLEKIPNKLYRELDSYVFHKLVLPLFKVKGNINYTHSINEAEKMAGLKHTAFILKAANLDSVIKISSNGFKLPQKSTYFYPKLLSGLVTRRFSK